MASTENPLIQDHAAMTLGGGAGGRQPLQQQQQHQHLHQSQQQHVRPASLGLTALMSSCQLNNELEVKALLQRKPSLTAARDRSGKTALHYCAENLTVGCAELLLLYEPGLTSVQDEEGYTTLHFAVISGNRTMVRFLVDRGADVNCVDNEKHSCVHWATVCGELECMDILVSAGANPSTADIHGAYPIHYAAQMCGPNSDMGNDVRVGLAALRRLIELGVDVSVRDQDGRPPLLWAASVETRPSKTYCPSGSSDAILALVNAGADVGATDKDGLTALHCAASRGHVDCLETLVSLCGADVDAVDSNGCSALFYAVTLGHADCTQLLLKYGAAPNRQDHKGRTPAHCGAAKGQMETLKILWQHGANLYMRNQRGDLPLHEAVQSGRKDLVQWLLELQPSAVNSPNNNGRCGLHVAAMANSVEMCKVLMDRGAEVNPVMRNSKGQLLTPLDASLQRGNRGCAKYLRLHGALPFCKMTDRHDIDRWLEHSFSINKLHKTEQLCDSQAPPAETEVQEELQLLDVKHVQTLESSVQTDSGYFESREYVAANNERLPGDVEAVTKQGTFIEGGRTLKQAIITNVYVRTSGGARVHQPRRKRAGGSKGKGSDVPEGSEETEEYSSSGEDRRAEKRETSQRKGGFQEGQATHKDSKKKHIELDSSAAHRVIEEVIVKKREGMEGHIVKRITRRSSGGEGDEVRVSGEVRDNVETTPEGFTSVTFSERKSSEAGRASSEEDTKAKLLAKESAASRTLGQVPEAVSRRVAKSPAVVRAAERFLALLTARRSRRQGQDTLREHTSEEAGEAVAVEETTRRLGRKAETKMVEEKEKTEKATRFQDKVKQTVKQARQSPKGRSSSSGRSSSESESAKTKSKGKAVRTKGPPRSLSREMSGSQRRQREARDSGGKREKSEKSARRAGKPAKDAELMHRSSSEQEQSSASDVTKAKMAKQNDREILENRETSTRPSKDVISAKKASGKPTKVPDQRTSTKTEEPSSSTEDSDSAPSEDDKQRGKTTKAPDSKATEAPPAAASTGTRKEKHAKVDERLESATRTKMHREYEEIESHATMAEFFSETSMSDSALEQRSDRHVVRHQDGAAEQAVVENPTEESKKSVKTVPTEEAHKAKGRTERKGSRETKAKDTTSQPREHRKQKGARKGMPNERDVNGQERDTASRDTLDRDSRSGAEGKSDRVAVRETEKRFSKIEEKFVHEVSSSESFSESRSEQFESDDRSSTKRTVSERKLGTKKQQSKKTKTVVGSTTDKVKSSDKTKPREGKQSTAERSGRKRSGKDSEGSDEERVSTEVCEEEIVEKRATELSVVEVLETKVAGEASRQVGDKTELSSKHKEGLKRPAKERMSDQDYEGDGHPEKAESGRTPGDHAKREREESVDSIQRAASAEGMQESLRSSLETTNVTKETSRMQRFEEEVSSEEITEKAIKEEIIERTSQITVEDGEPVASGDFAAPESVEKTDLVGMDEDVEKGRLSSTVAEAVVDLYSRVQRSLPGVQNASELEKKPCSSLRLASPEIARTENASAQESSKATEEEPTKDEDQGSRLDTSSIPPLVAEAVSDLFAHVKQLASTSTSPKERPPSTRDTASSPVVGPPKVERACGSEDIGLVDAACSTRQSSAELSEKGVSPEGEEYTAEVACGTVADETASVACSPAVQKADASCSPAESVDQPVEDATCSPISTVLGKDRERADASCSPILELAEESPEMKDAVCSPALEPAEKTDAASSPADITATVDAQSSPVDMTADQEDSASSPFISLIRQDEQVSPMIVEVHDKETWTGSAEDMTADASCTPLMSEKTPDRAEPIEKTDTATSPMDQEPTRDSECSPIIADLGKETRDVACSPLESSVPTEERNTVSTAVSPIHISDEVSDKATSPPETFPTVHTGISPFPLTPGVEQASSPHKAYTKDAYSSPIEQSAQDQGTVEPITTEDKPATADVCLGTSPEESKISEVEVADASCSPVAFEYARLSRSSSGSTEVDIAVRSSSIEEATKTPMTDIAAIPAFTEMGTSPIGEVRTVAESDSAGVQAEPTIADSGTSPLGALAKTRGTSTEGKEAELAFSDTCTSPLDSFSLVKSGATRDASSSPIQISDTTALTKRTLKDVVRLRKPGPLRKTKSWDAMGYGNLDDIRPTELLFPDIRHPAKAVQRITPTSGITSPVDDSINVEKLKVEDTLQLQKLPSIIKTASTPPDTATAGQQDADSKRGSPSGIPEGKDKKTVSLQPVGVKRHSLTQSDHDRSPESSVRSSDYTATTLKDSGFSDVEKHATGVSSAEEDDGTDRQGVLSDSAAQELELQRRRLLHSRRKMREGDDEEASPGRDDTDGSAAEDGARARSPGSGVRRFEAEAGESPRKKTKVKAKDGSESDKGQRIRRGQPDLQPLSESKKVSEDLTMTVQESLRKYRVERQLFSELQELKRHQIRSGRTHENVLVKRLVDRFRELVLAPGMRDFSGPYTFRNYERYLYGHLRDLSRSNDGKVPAKYRKREDEYDEYESGAVSDGPLECVSRAYGRSRQADDYGAETEIRNYRELGQFEAVQYAVNCSIAETFMWRLIPDYRLPNTRSYKMCREVGRASATAHAQFASGDAGEAEVREGGELENVARISKAATASGEEAETATGTIAASQKTRHVQPSQPVGRKNLLPAILPSPLTSMFTVVRGAPPLPTARTGYGHVRSRVFPQRPAQKINLTESDRSPKKTARGRKEASTSTTEVLSNQASRLRAERIRKQREEEERTRKRREETSSRAAAEVTSRLHGSVQNLRRISEEESLERAAATDGALSEQEGASARKKYRSTSLTREAARRSDHEARVGKPAAASAVRETPATRTFTKDKKLAPMDKPYSKSQEAAQMTADANKPVFPYLKKREGRLSVVRGRETRESETSATIKSQQASVQERRTISHAAQRAAEAPLSEQYDSHYATTESEPATPRRPFSKAREATATTPKKSSALLPFWVPHDSARTDVAAKEQEQHHRSSVRDSLGEQQAVRFKDWIKARQRSGTASIERASAKTADAATEALAREVRLREGDSSETDSGHEGDGILPDDQRVKEVLLERVSRSLRKNVLPQDVVTMRLKPSPPTAVADQIEAITRTVRMSEFLEAARRDIVVNCVQLRPDNVSDGSPSSSPEEVPSPAASSGDGGSVSDGGAVDDDDGVLEFEIRHGREKNVFWLPTNKIRDNKKWQVTFIVARTDRE